MHVLVINDDGPPSNKSSPYVHALVHYLQQVGHLVSVVLPHQQRSWIGKAHFVGQLTKPSYFHPGTIHEDDGTVHERPSSDANQEEWVLVDGTPATCAQLGLHHFFQDRPPIDIVISGPNYGRNSTSLFSLSSGTIGGAMEAAVFRKRSIALSFAFWSRDHKPDVVAGACKHSIKLIEYLAANWGEGVDLYSINVPLVENFGENKILYTHALQNYWRSGSSFEEVEAEDSEDPQEQEKEIREIGEGNEGDVRGKNDVNIMKSSLNKHKWFKWAPKFGDVQKSVDSSEPGNDGWAINKGYTSVTPLKANYMHATEVPLGELKLKSQTTDSSNSTTSPRPIEIFAIIAADSYTAPLIKQAFMTTAPQVRLVDFHGNLAFLPRPDSQLLQIRPYEDIDFDHHLAQPTTSLANSYIIRKALIRKNYLWNTISTWRTKHPNETALKNHVPLTVTFELDYAEFLDDALLECFELHDSFAKTTPEWWILKPAMSDQGQGVRLFSSLAELQVIFDEWEADSPSDEDNGFEDDDDNQDAKDNSDNANPVPKPEPTNPSSNDQPSNSLTAGTITSQLRHFTAQLYVAHPLILPYPHNRKFHIRTYTLAVGALKVYVYREMLALFAPGPYVHPSKGLDAESHLTNTCLHDSSLFDRASSVEDQEKPVVVPFWSLPPLAKSEDWKHHVFEQIQETTSTLFQAAAKEQQVHFQTLPNSFEIFGVDWLVDEEGCVWLLEVNSFPDFRQSREVGKGIVGGLWEGVVETGIMPFFGYGRNEGLSKTEGEKGFVEVLNIDLGRR